MSQPRYQTVGHDSIQYHFFCQGRLFALRVFRTETLEHHSAWIFEDGHLREVLSSTAPLFQSRATSLDISGPTLTLAADGRRGTAAVMAGTADDTFSATFSVRRSYRWNYVAATSGEDVEHQPDLDCVVTHRGRALTGLGYHKRYFWRRPPHYWGYRFLHGVLDDGTVVWTADATFGTSKYDYFKVLDTATGELTQSAPTHSAHKDDHTFGDIAGERHETVFTEHGVWEKTLRSAAMDSHLRQRAGTFEHRAGGRSRRGVALTETCFGTLG